MPKRYVPDRGDVVWLELNPEAGHLTALVLSPKAYNGKVGLMLCCPITSQAKSYPFEVLIQAEPMAIGVALADQVKSLDWREHRALYKARVNDGVVDEALAKAKALLA